MFAGKDDKEQRAETMIGQINQWMTQLEIITNHLKFLYKTQEKNKASSHQDNEASSHQDNEASSHQDNEASSHQDIINTGMALQLVSELMTELFRVKIQLNLPKALSSLQMQPKILRELEELIKQNN